MRYSVYRESQFFSVIEEIGLVIRPIAELMGRKIEYFPW